MFEPQHCLQVMNAASQHCMLILCFVRALPDWRASFYTGRGREYVRGGAGVPEPVAAPAAASPPGGGG